MEDNAHTDSIAKPEINVPSVLVQNSCMTIQQVQQELYHRNLPGATQKEKSNSQCYCSVYICALGLSVP